MIKFNLNLILFSRNIGILILVMIVYLNSNFYKLFLYLLIWLFLLSENVLKKFKLFSLRFKI